MHHDTELLPLTAMLGSDAGAAAQMAQQKNWSLSPVAPDYQTSEAQIRYAVQEEWARTLSDVMLRRTRLAYSPDNGLPVAHGVASIMGSALAWPQERTTAEIQAYTAYVNAYLQAHRHRS
ncbi:MAG TPA: glycerol-3-phosphate dehydrogenase C-terminal domain-containing protein, partial [bacterium]|nr:glycerol-3-phosphate dehydrogenase C-terminal domain-containing protein [bacterium]